MSKDRILIIVESPNKIKTISQLLKGTKYENAIIMASVGHISEIANKKDSYQNTGIYPDNNFKTNYVISTDKKDIVEKLKEQVELASIVYICSDPDREGEAIAWSLKKFLKINKDKCKRCTFHEITKNALLNALDNPREIDDNLVEAAQSRQKLDKMLGYRLSPIAKRIIGAKSVGRCQSAGLKLIVDKEKQIQEFIPVEYGDLTLNFNKNGIQFKAKYFGENNKEIKQPKYDFCVEVQKDCEALTTKKEWYYIKEVTTKQRFSSPKPPFTTSTFQQEVSSKLGIGIKESMNYAQKLFEGIDVNGKHIALITYIRTDSCELAKEFIPKLKEYVINTYGKDYYSPLRKVENSENAQDGHEAIRPVDLSMTPELLSNYIENKYLLKVYEMIYRRTVAAMMHDSITNETIYSINLGSHYFNLSSKELEFDGFLKVYNYKNALDDEPIKESFELGEVLNEKYSPKLNLIKKQTLPPARYKEATFIKELESSGIGRPSTFATIVETLLDKSRGYCILDDKNIVPTERGITLSNYLDKSFPKLININYTSELEKELDQIANGKLDEISFLTNFYTNMENYIKEAKEVNREFKKVKQEHIINEEQNCPLCGSPLYLRKGAYGEFWGCSKYPKCKGIVKKN